MLRRHFRSMAVPLAVAMLVGVPAPARTAAVNEKEARDLGVEAYVYGYPLITMEMTRRVVTNVTEPKGAHAPMGQFANLREYPNASFKDVTAPNADTLYSSAFLDLSKEPYVLSLPSRPAARISLSGGGSCFNMVSFRRFQYGLSSTVRP